MVRNTENGRYTPCNSNVMWMTPDEDGNINYINLDGKNIWGYLTEYIGNKTCEIGYRKHSTTCKGRVQRHEMSM